MYSSTQLYSIVILLVVIITVILSMFFPLPLSLLVAIACALAFYFFVKKPGADEEDEAETPPSSNELAVEALLSVNLELRKTIVPAEMREAFESIIDQLLKILTEATELDADSELGWVINRMATEYLPEKSIRPYLMLDESMRHDQGTIASVLEGLAGMKKELADVEDILSSRKTNEFNAKAKFLKHRFDI